MSRRLVVIKSIVFFTLFLVLAGCGGGGGGGVAVTSTVLEGTVAAGAPVVGQVWIKDHRGKEIGPVSIQNDGTFKVDARGLEPPFIIRAQGVANNASHNLYSITTSYGKVNINTLTNPIVTEVTGYVDLDLLYDTYSGVAKAVTAEKIASAERSIRELIKPFIDAAALNANYDIIHGDHPANGKGLDGIMDLIDVSINIQAKSIVLQLKGRDLKTEILVDDLSRGRIAEAVAVLEANRASIKALLDDKSAIEQMILRLQDLYREKNITAGKLDTFFANDEGDPEKKRNVLYGLNSGKTREQEIDEWVRNLAGPMPNWTAKNVYISPRGSSSYLVRVDAKLPGIKGTATWYFTVAKDGDELWKFVGNGNVITHAIRPKSLLVYNGENVVKQHIGIWIYLRSYNFSPDSINYAIVTGPGLPVSGLRLSNPGKGLNFKPAGFTLAPELIYEVPLSNIPSRCKYTISLYDAAGELVHRIDQQLANISFTDVEIMKNHYTIKEDIPTLKSKQLAMEKDHGTITMFFSQPQNPLHDDTYNVETFVGGNGLDRKGLSYGFYSHHRLLATSPADTHDVSDMMKWDSIAMLYYGVQYSQDGWSFNTRWDFARE